MLNKFFLLPDVLRKNRWENILSLYTSDTN